MTQQGKPILQALPRLLRSRHRTHPRRSTLRAAASGTTSSGVVQRAPKRAAAAIVRDWLRFEPTARFDDPARPLILLDTFGWPAVYERYRGAGYTAPNLDVCVTFHRSATASDWLLIDHECPVADDGLLGVSGRVWSNDGRLLASGVAQLCCIPLPTEA